MADMETNLETIATGRYGRDVRAAIHDAIAENADNIEDLKARPSGGASLALTGQRRLTTSDAGKILSLDVMGKSGQIDTRKFSFSQGAIVPTVGSRLDQDINANESRCTSDILELTIGTVISAPAGYEIYIAHAATASGSIDISQTWVTTYTTSTGGFWRIVCRNKSNTSATIRPSECNINIAGQPTPDHEIPIVNASGVIQAIGKNLFDPHYGYHTSASGFVTDYAGAIGAGSDLIPCNSGDNYVFTMTAWSGAVIWVGYYNSSKGFINRVAITNGAIITIPSGTSFFFVSIYASNITPESYPQVMLELGTTATAYEPYQSNEIDLSAYDLRSAGTAADELIVYPDKTGKLIKRTGVTTIGALDWRSSASGSGRFYADVEDGSPYTDPICTAYKYSPNAYEANTISRSKKSSTEDILRIYVGDARYSSANEFKNGMSSTIIYYEFATPIETALTAEQVAEILALETYAPETIIETELDVQSVGYTGDVKGYIDSKFEYSYTIRKIGKWADGKDFYQAVINTTTPAANADGLISNIINGTNCSIKKLTGIIQSADSVYVPISDYYNSGTFASIWIDTGGIKLRTNTAIYANKPCEITVEFTYKDAAPAAASVMALTDNDIQSEQSDDGLKKGTIIDDTVVYGGN